MDYLVIVILSVTASWFVADIKTKKHLFQIDKMFDEQFNELKEATKEVINNIIH